MPFRLICLAALLPLLAACDSAAPVADDDAARAASGEVLQGSISDDMLPLEDLSSQPPLAAPLPGEEVASPAGTSETAPAAVASAQSAGAADAAAAPANEAAGEE